MSLTVGSLFSGIGGLDLGLERAGMTVRWQSEIDPYCSQVLAKHWPDVPNLGDITNVDWEHVERVDVVCGGFPCQPFSVAGRQGGRDDPRHLWPHFRDALRVLRPRYALLENVPGLLVLGFGEVAGDLADLGYDFEWDCIPAAAVGAPHLRYRVFVVAVHADAESQRRSGTDIARPNMVNDGLQPSYVREVLADPGGTRRREDPRGAHGDEAADEGRPAEDDHVADGDGQGGGARLVADADGSGLQGHGTEHGLREDRKERQARWGRDVADSDDERRNERAGVFGQGRRGQLADSGQWATEPDVGRVAHGIPSRVDRLRGLGNAVVPQVAEWVGRQLIDQSELT